MPGARTKLPGKGRDARIRRHTRAMMQLAQRLWRAGDGLEAALGVIAETGARELGVDGATIWQLVPPGILHCMHRLEGESGVDALDDFNLRIDITGTTYAKLIPATRVIHVADIATSPVFLEPGMGLSDSLRANGVGALLHAPIRFGDEVFGVLCFEQHGGPREWRGDEIAFAGNMADYAALALEIDRRKRAEERVKFLELHDPVTSLANRSLFLGALQDLIKRQARRPRLAALLFVGLDHFASVNESLGEAGGDRVLAELGERINAATPDEAVIARVESDCFAVLVPRVAQEWQAVRIAEEVLAAVTRPLQVDGCELVLGASIGIAFHHGGTATTSDAWLRDADLASKQAKNLGRDRCEIFDPDQHSGLIDRLSTERRLRDALHDESLVVVYQAQVDIASGEVIAAEALLRWRDAQGVLRCPADFIEIAESSGLIVPIGRLVLHQACAAASQWPPLPDGRPRKLSVNLSARQFEQAGLAETVADVLAETGFDPARLCLEITETTLMTRAQSALDTLHALKRLGVSLSVDDFGTGYSSLAYLQRFPVDELKIDKSLVDGIPDSPQAGAIVVAVLGLARALGLHVVVEGVERREQETVLRAVGCSTSQGWLYAKGEPDADFVARLQRRDAPVDAEIHGDANPVAVAMPLLTLPPPRSPPGSHC